MACAPMRFARAKAAMVFSGAAADAPRCAMMRVTGVRRAESRERFELLERLGAHGRVLLPLARDRARLRLPVVVAGMNDEVVIEVREHLQAHVERHGIAA